MTSRNHRSWGSTFTAPRSDGPNVNGFPFDSRQTISPSNATQGFPFALFHRMQTALSTALHKGVLAPVLPKPTSFLSSISHRISLLPMLHGPRSMIPINRFLSFLLAHFGGKSGCVCACRPFDRPNDKNIGSATGSSVLSPSPLDPLTKASKHSFVHPHSGHR